MRTTKLAMCSDAAALATVAEDVAAVMTVAAVAAGPEEAVAVIEATVATGLISALLSPPLPTFTLPFFTLLFSCTRVQSTLSEALASPTKSGSVTTGSVTTCTSICAFAFTSTFASTSGPSKKSLE
jgi:hypothetical protein